MGKYEWNDSMLSPPDLTGNLVSTNKDFFIDLYTRMANDPELKAYNDLPDNLIKPDYQSLIDQIKNGQFYISPSRPTGPDQGSGLMGIISGYGAHPNPIYSMGVLGPTFMGAGAGLAALGAEGAAGAASGAGGATVGSGSGGSLGYLDSMAAMNQGALLPEVGSSVTGAPIPAMDTLAGGGAIFGNATPYTNPITGVAAGSAASGSVSPFVAGFSETAVDMTPNEIGTWEARPGSGVGMDYPGGQGLSAMIPNFSGTAGYMGDIPFTGMKYPSIFGGTGGLDMGSLPYLYGGGALLNYLGNRKNADAYKEGMDRYINAISWNPERRDAYMGNMTNYINSIYGPQAATAKNTVSGALASDNRGGGSFSRAKEKIDRERRGLTAKALSGALATTYAPPNVSPAAYNIPNPEGTTLTGMAQNMGSLASTIALMKFLGNMGG